MNTYNPYRVAFDEWFNPNPDDPLMKYKQPMIDQALRKQQEKMATAPSPLDSMPSVLKPKQSPQEEDQKAIETLKTEIDKPIPQPTNLKDVAGAFTESPNVIDNIMKGLGKAGEFLGTAGGQTLLGHLNKDPYSRLGRFAAGGNIYKKEQEDKLKAEERKAAFTKQLADIYEKQREAKRKSEEEDLQRDFDIKKLGQQQDFTSGQSELEREFKAGESEKDRIFREKLADLAYKRELAKESRLTKKEKEKEKRGAFRDETTLRQEYEKNSGVKEQTILINGLAKMKSVYDAYAKEPTNSNKSTLDQTLITVFNKMLDPGSVVREGEYARTAEGQSALDFLEGKLKAIQKGGKLSPAERKQIVDTANQLVKGHLKSSRATYDRYKGYASEYDFEPERIVGAPLYFHDEAEAKQYKIPKGTRIIVGDDLFEVEEE